MSANLFVNADRKRFQPMPPPLAAEMPGNTGGKP
jgi:hypothetical protein